MAEDEIKVFDANDQNLKMLGELLANESSRNIIKLLINKQMYTNEIAKKLDMRVSLVIHHLKKMEDLELLEITHKQIVRKGNNHRYFKMVPNLFLTPGHTQEENEEKGTLKKFFREGIKFSCLALSGFFTYAILSPAPLKRG